MVPHKAVLSHLFFGAGQPHHLWQLATRPGWGTALGLCHAAAASLEAVSVDSGVFAELLPCNPTISGRKLSSKAILYGASCQFLGRTTVFVMRTGSQAGWHFAQRNWLAPQFGTSFGTILSKYLLRICWIGFIIVYPSYDPNYPDTALQKPHWQGKNTFECGTAGI